VSFDSKDEQVVLAAGGGGGGVLRTSLGRAGFSRVETNSLTPWSRVLLRSQQFRSQEFSRLVVEPHSQAPAISTYPKQAQSSPLPWI